MPWKAKHPCNAPGCGKATRERFCERHAHRAKVVQDEPREKTKARGYGGQWRRRASMILNAEPVCRICQRMPATEVDHITPRRLGGEDTDENLQGLCRSCHSRKTATEDGGFGMGARVKEDGG